MGMMLNNTVFSAVTNGGEHINPDWIASFNTLRSFYRADRNGLFRNRAEVRIDSGNDEWEEQRPQIDDVASFRILLVGNELMQRQAIRNTLTQHLTLAIDYVESWSGEIALRILGREAIDLIVFGDDVADMDGLEFLGLLKRKSGTSQIPVIEILGSGAASTGIQAMKMGAHDYLLKDFDGHHFELLPILVSRIYAEQQAMQTLHQTAGVRQTITDSIPSVIYQLSLQGGRHEVCISPQISALGFTADQWGSDAELHHQMCHEGDRETVRKALEHSYQTGSAFQCEYRVNTVGNTLRWFHDKAQVVMDKFGRPLFLHGVMTDITGIKSLEAELVHYRHMMEKMVRQRTERLDRRVAILESCNSSLSENYGRMRQMYLELLLKAQAVEVEMGTDGTI